MGVVGRITSGIVATYSRTLPGSTGVSSVLIGESENLSVTDGTAADQCDRAWSSNPISLAVGFPVVIDMFDLAAFDIGPGPGEDPLGFAVSLVDIVGIRIHVDRDSVGHLLVGGEGSAAAWSDPWNGDDDAKSKVYKGGHIQLAAPMDPGYPVADGSNHLLQLEAIGGAVTCDVTFIGRDS